MKHYLLTIFTFITFSVFAQDLPTEPASGYAFPIGSKFTIKLIPIDSVSFNYSIIKYEQFTETIDTWENDKLFAEKGKDNTIDFYFCLGTEGKTEDEKKKNMKVLLIFKNNSKYSMNFDSDIQRKEDGEYEKTSNMGTYKGAKGTEMWPYMIHSIGLNNFKRKK
ncbi:hypothetical protein GKZ90_0013140 [Flavobacterium sp. MC2016-06]|jgi:hypothetical protein|uniref:hypothetical protein n=1 Tax=Flavobacterium sp. MC2016-06 TaxID=2676308 RepID=UPI0012BAC11F|nr:hypothetical protein [Flavobacterium sp. MC2016-06]MBU3859966.1 hypothetical protein [Flavobacterium sp. MC2016-06]